MGYDDWESYLMTFSSALSLFDSSTIRALDITHPILVQAEFWRRKHKCRTLSIIILVHIVLIREPFVTYIGKHLYIIEMTKCINYASSFEMILTFKGN